MRSGSSTTSTSGRRSSPSLPERVLTTRELNRALLARQLLLERSRLPLARALEKVAGLQTQYAPSAYIGLWSRLESFELPQLTRALERKRAVQGTLMRSTIHVVSARDYWLFADGIGPSREAWWRKTHGKSVEGDVGAVREQLRAELAGRVWNRKELEELHRTYASTIWQGAWIELVRVPPSGTWERRRADLFQLAEEWIGASRRGRGEGARAPAAPLSRWIRAGNGERGGQLGRRPGDEDEGGSRAPRAAPLPRRGRQGAPRPPARAAPGDVPGARPLPPDLGRDAPRPRAPDPDPPRAVPSPHLQHEERRSSFAHVPRRRHAWPASGAGSAPARRRRYGSSRSSGCRAAPLARCATRPRGSSDSSSRTRPRTR